MYYLHHIPKLIQHCFPQFIWTGPQQGKEKNIYLTFDDGPTPEVTDFILDQLGEYEAHATFFCLGKQIEKHPSLFERILNEGHAVGNHTYSHLDGWKTETAKYLADVKKCGALTKSPLFRPPYGRIKRQQVKMLQEHPSLLGIDADAMTQIVMWDVMTGDFDIRMNADKCNQVIEKFGEINSIITMHDNIKSFKINCISVPFALNHFTCLGYSCKSLTMK